MTKPKKRKRARVGDVVSIALPDGSYGFGRILTDPFIGFYHLQSDIVPPIEEIVLAPIAFKIAVSSFATKSDQWEILENVPLTDELKEEPLFFKKDLISGELTIYRDSTAEEIPATLAECESLECAAVWDPEHVVDRLVDLFAGRPNQWVESMRP